MSSLPRVCGLQIAPCVLCFPAPPRASSLTACALLPGPTLPAADDRADERLHAILRQREVVLDEIHRGGGPTAAAAAGSGEAMRPLPPRSLREEYEAAVRAVRAGAAGASGMTGSGSLAGAAGSWGSGKGGNTGPLAGGGLVITDQPPPTQHESEAAQQLVPLQAVRGPQAQLGSTATASSNTSEDPFAMLLGASSSGWEHGDETGAAEAASAAEKKQQRQRQRRKDWWWRHSTRVDEAAAP